MRAASMQRGVHQQQQQHQTAAGRRVLAAQQLLARPLHRTAQAQRHVAAAAAAAADAGGLDAVDVVPYISSRAPKLLSRCMRGSALDALWGAASTAGTRLELAAAALVDRHTPLGPLAMSVLAGLLTGLGIGGLTLLQQGLPPHVQDLLLELVGAWDTSAWRLLLAALALPASAWALRCWWIASMHVLAGPGGAMQRLLQQQPAPAVQALLGAALAAVRGACLVAAAGSITRALGSSSAMQAGIAAATAVVTAAAAAAPALLQLAAPRRSSGAAAGSSPRAAVLLLALDAAWLLAAVGLSPLANASASLAVAGSLFALHVLVVAPRMRRFRAAVGDAAEVHLALRLPGGGSVFDSTVAEAPLRVVVAPRPREHVEAWELAATPGLWADDDGDDSSSGGGSQARAQQAQARLQALAAEAAARDASGSGSGSGGSADEQAAPARDLASAQAGVQAWLDTPEARWAVLAPFAAEAAAGLFLGQTAQLSLLNPPAVGYWNAAFTWWQPTEDVAAKFKGRLPEPGDVFWYPVAPGAAVPTRVASVGQRHVELDANYGVTNTQLQLEVTLVRVAKQAE